MQKKRKKESNTSKNKKHPNNGNLRLVWGVFSQAWNILAIFFQGVRRNILKMFQIVPCVAFCK